MSLFGSNEAKLDKKLEALDEALLYKKSLAALETQAKENFSGVDNAGLAAIVLHHDLQEQNDHLKNIEELLKNKK
ncbi:hypothetical protein [Limosilactobacillus kribbianus]|uniref:hypothetical protein n=1 Tax=Limosilactobacillus kribbianus TaxID=2982695 RepID=UPI0022646C1E|nr:hypothetical protein [Limosilactobacillus kribbianus]